MKIGACVVLYQPSKETPSRIETYRKHCDRLYLVDNTPQPDPFWKEQASSWDNAVYLPLGANLGIAAALNTGARQAQQDGMDWLLTMDQDSSFPAGTLEGMIERAASDTSGDLAILSPYHVDDIIPEPKPGLPEEEDMDAVMTSGNLLSLKAYEKGGPFLDKLFIDFVDNEYCLRLHSLGFRVVRMNRLLLRHNLGAPTRCSFLGIKFTTTHHSAIRRYYSMRNRLYGKKLYGKLYPAYFKTEFRSALKETVKIILGEKQKYRKLRAIALGIFDYLRGVSGPCPHRI